MAMDINQLQQMQMQPQPQLPPTNDTPLPNVKQSTLLILALLDHVVQREDLNLQVQVQSIQGLTQSVKLLADILDRPDQAERVMNMVTKTRPEMLQQVGQLAQPRYDDTPQVMDNLQAQP